MFITTSLNLYNYYNAQYIYKERFFANVEMCQIMKSLKKKLIQTALRN